MAAKTAAFVIEDSREEQRWECAAWEEVLDSRPFAQETLPVERQVRVLGEILREVPAPAITVCWMQLQSCFDNAHNVFCSAVLTGG
jgi:hypothetical protein